ncbi:MAG: nucleotide-binding domain containing protein, partial [Hoeflea sp.]|nr:nucleotide-binding domain containing protein [Hoeflea sp.]
VARRLRDEKFTRFLIAGGETSGAVVASLGVTMLEIGPEIDPGVPWTRSLGTPDLALALKSGNFGTPDFFLKAWSLLETEHADV